MQKALLTKIQTEMLAAVQAVAKQYDVSITANGGSIGSGYADLKIRVAQLAENGEIVTPEGEALKVDFPKLVGKTFESRGKKFTLTGYKPRNSKFPFIANSLDGKSFKFTSDVVRREFPDAKIPAWI